MLTARPPYRRSTGWIALSLALAAAAAVGAGLAAADAEPEANDPDDADEDANRAAGPALPGITIDHEAGHVELDAQVVLRDADWLELIVCSPNTREHESILTAEARPSHIHLALIMLGLEPGQPMVWRREGEDFHSEPPRGHPVELFYILEDDDGQTQKIAANEWIYDEQAERAMQGNIWLFTGSAIQEFQDQQHYMADLNGTIVSLVNFGDDLLARPTDLTNMTDQEQFNTYTERIPEEGTELKLRIVPVELDEDELDEHGHLVPEDFDPPVPEDDAGPPGP